MTEACKVERVMKFEITENQNRSIKTLNFGEIFLYRYHEKCMMRIRQFLVCTVLQQKMFLQMESFEDPEMHV